MSEEVWKEIDGQPGYFVSNHGRVRHPAGIFAPWRLYTGYMQIKIKHKAYAIHRLVAGSFCEGRFNGAVVNHKNGLRDDNRAENLEWVTRSENLRHAYRELGVEAWTKGKFSKEHCTSKAVVSTNIGTGKETFYWCGLDAVRDDGFDSSSISRCCNGIWKYHKGHYWRFATEEEYATHAFGGRKGVQWSPTSLGRNA